MRKHNQSASAIQDNSAPMLPGQDDETPPASGQEPPAEETSAGPPPEPPAAEPPPAANGEAPPDPFSLEALSLGEDYAEAFVADEGRPAAIPVRKPSRDWFIRCHPDRFLNVRLLEVKEGEDRGYYLVARPLWETLAAADLPLKPVRLTLAITRDGTAFLWPLKLPEHKNRQDEWTASALRIAKAAETVWVKVYTRPGGTCYSYRQAEAPLPEPAWPTLSMKEWVDLAFEGKKIAERGDPLVLRLLGEA